MLLLLLGPVAQGAPFNAYGYRTEVGTLGLNPYVGAELGEDITPAETAWTSLFVFAGITPWMDVALAGNGAVGAGFESAELVPRLFPFEDVELALVGHLIAGPEEVLLGPELHFAQYVTPSLGFWVNLGARYPLGGPLRPQTFAWVAGEVTGDVTFFALEVDVEAVPAQEPRVTVIPSFGVWLGKRQETGLSAGWLLPTRGETVGFGLWLWRTIDLRGEGRRRRQRPPPKAAG